MATHNKFKFGENAFWACPNILVKSEKLDLNALLNRKSKNLENSQFLSQAN